MLKKILKNKSQELNEKLTPAISPMLGQKRGQAGETVTWIVATVIIVIILFVSIFIASVYLGGGKEFSFIKQADSLATKSFFSYLLTKDNQGKTVYEQMKDEENLNSFNGNLAVGIFKVYEKDYPVVWVGLALAHNVPPYVSNDYFGGGNIKVRVEDSNIRSVLPIIEDVPLNEKKSIEIINHLNSFIIEYPL